MAIYEGKDKNGKLKRSFKLINNMDVANLYKLNIEKNKVIPKTDVETGYLIKHVIKKGISVILLQTENEEFDYNNQKWINDRIYIITGIDKDGIKLCYNKEARSTTDLIKYMIDKINKYNQANNITDKNGVIKKSKLTSPKGGDVIGKYKNFPYIKIKPNAFFAKVENVDFNITSTGKIEKC